MQNPSYRSFTVSIHFHYFDIQNGNHSHCSYTRSIFQDSFMNQCLARSQRISLILIHFLLFLLDKGFDSLNPSPFRFAPLSGLRHFRSIYIFSEYSFLHVLNVSNKAILYINLSHIFQFLILSISHSYHLLQ